MKSFKAHGDYPKTVYRVFDKIEYVTDFLNGSLRFSRLQNYKHIEDELRRDNTEGEAYIIYNGLSHHSMFASNSFYILCFHRTLEAAKQSKFGKFIVEINNPRQLAVKITKWLDRQPYKHFGGIEGVNIEYTHGEELSVKPNRIDLARLTYAQKPNFFSNEQEFRLVFIRESCKDDYIFVDIDVINKLCSMVTHCV